MADPVHVRDCDKSVVTKHVTLNPPDINLQKMGLILYIQLIRTGLKNDSK